MLAKAEEKWHQGVVLFNTLPLRHLVSGSVWPSEKKFEGDVGKFPERSTHALRPPCSGGLSAWHSAKTKTYAPTPSIDRIVAATSRFVKLWITCVTHSHHAMVFQSTLGKERSICCFSFFCGRMSSESHTVVQVWGNKLEHVAARGGERNARQHKWTREGVKSSHETATNATPSREMKKQYGAIFSQQKRFTFAPS